MTALFATALIVTCLIMVLWPLFRGRPEETDIEAILTNHEKEFTRARERIYQEIRTVQQEWLIKNISEESYRSELSRLRIEAALILKTQSTTKDKILEIQKEMEAATGGTS